MGADASKPCTQAPTLDQTADDCSQYDSAKAPFWNEDRTAVMEPIVSKQGVASEAPVTLFDFFEVAVKKHGDKPALALELPCPSVENKSDKGEWTYWTFSEYYAQVQMVGKAMIKLGLQPHDGVNIFGFNSPEWFMGELGGMMAGGIAAGIYPSDTPDQVEFKSRHSASSIACCETIKQGDTFKKLKAEGKLPALKAIIVWDRSTPFETYTAEGDVTVVHWSKLEDLAKDVTDEQLQERVSAAKPGSVCAYIYTSGTTGTPKAVMVTHDNIVYISKSCMTFNGDFGLMNQQERIISYLPLSHVAGMLVDIICPIAVTALKKGWVTCYFARPYDLKVGTIVDRMRSVHPTLFLGVPRVWEKIMEKMKAVGATTKGFKKSLATFGKSKGLELTKAQQMGGSGKAPGGYGIAKKVLDKVAKAIGLDQLRIALTGAAPITIETLEYFGALAISINEVYGMSESCGATTWSSPEAHVWGACGWAIPGSEIKAFRFEGGKRSDVPAAKDLFHPTEEEQGELCFRGRHIMAGYMANPDLGEDHVNEIKKKNAEAIDDEGWMHSGDKGCIDARGMVRITGRYKELIITAGGENVAPVPIEDNIKALCGAVSNIMMIGDKQKFNIALITLKCEGATGELAGTDMLTGAAATIDPDAKNLRQACDSELMIKAITKAITDTNNNGEVCPSSASKIQKFSILPIDFSVETGELTATLKLKRSVATNKYADLIASIYASKETFVKYVGEEPAYRPSEHPGSPEPDAADKELKEAAEAASEVVNAE